MRLYLLSKEVDQDNPLSYLNCKDEFIIVTFNAILLERLIEKKINVITIDEILETEDCINIEKIVEKSIEDIQKFYSNKFLFNDIDFFKCVQYELSHILIFLIKIYKAFEKIFRLYNISEFVSDFSKSSIIIQLLRKLYSGKIYCIGNTKLNSNDLLKSIVNSLNYLTFETKLNNRKEIKTIILRLLLFIRKLIFINKKKSVFIYPSKQIFPVLNNIIHRLNYKVVIAIENVSIEYFIKNFFNRNIIFINIYRSLVFPERVKKIDLKVYNKIDYKIDDILNNIINLYVRKWYGIFKSSIKHLKRELDKNSIKLYISPNDTLFESKISVFLCKKLGIPSLIVQHGYLAWFGDQNHKFGDYSAFVNQGIVKTMVQRYSLREENCFIFNFFDNEKSIVNNN